MPGKTAILTVLATTALLVSACVSHVRTPFEGAGGAGQSSSPIYPWSGGPPEVSNSDLTEQDSSYYRVKHLSFDSVGVNGQPDNRVDVIWYLGRESGPKPAVIVMPIWGSYTYPPEKIATGLRKMGEGGVNVLHVQGENRVLDWNALGSAGTEEEFLARMADNFARIRTNVVDLKRLVDWASGSPEIAADRIGLVGFSHSAIVASLAAINDQRLRATVIMMAGAHPHLVFGHCDGRVGELRSTVLARFGWTVETYQELLQPLTRDIDSASFPGRADPSEILVIDAEKDECFPVESREAMWLSLGQPERYTIGYSHKISFLSMTPFGYNWLRQPVYDFLDAQLRISQR